MPWPTSGCRAIRIRRRQPLRCECPKRPGPCRARSQRSCSSACAIMTPRPRRPCSGCTRGLRPKRRRRTTSSIASISDQGAVNVSVRNVITSLRLISSVDWAKFFESVSLVDETLRDQSAFGSFDFATRDSYRHAIEEIARRSNHTEMDVARAPWRPPRSRRARRAHAESEPGYYLVSAGRAELERELGYRTPWNERCARVHARGGRDRLRGRHRALSIAVTAAFLLAGLRHPARILAIGHRTRAARALGGLRYRYRRRQSLGYAFLRSPRAARPWNCSTACPRNCAPWSPCRSS